MSNDIKSVWVVCVNDFHAEIEETENTPGCAKLVSALNEFANEHPNTIFVFGGDNYKGDPISEYFYGEPVTQMMRLVGVKASALGNHEFDFGPELIQKWQQDGQYRFLSANIRNTATGKQAEFASPYLIIECAGAKIALLGLCMKESLSTVDRPPEMHAYEITDPVDAAKRWICTFRGSDAGERKADAVIALTHFGLRYETDEKTPVGEEALALCREVSELSGVFTAHLHQFMSLSISGIPAAQGGSCGRGYAVLRLDFSKKNNLLSVTPEYVDLRSRQQRLPPDPQMERIVTRCKQIAMEKLGEVIGIADRDIIHRTRGENEVDPEGTPLSALGIRVMLESTGCQIALFYAGRMGKGFPKGEVTLYQLYQTFLFHNGIVTMELPGWAILANLETGICTLRQESRSPLAVGGMKVTADYQKPYGHRVESVLLSNGEPLSAEQYYSVAIDDYLAENPLGFDFSSGENIYYTGISVRERMIEEIRTTKRVESAFIPSICLKNKPLSATS